MKDAGLCRGGGGGGAGKEQPVKHPKSRFSLASMMNWPTFPPSCSPCLLYLPLNKRNPPDLPCWLESNDLPITAGPPAIIQRGGGNISGALMGTIRATISDDFIHSTCLF